MKNNDETKCLESASAHSIGKVRRCNEDAMFTFEAELMQLNKKKTCGLYIVADGMGGHANGDLASAAVVSNFVHEFFTTIYPALLESRVPAEHEELHTKMDNALRKANHVILDTLPGSGTTFTAALVENNQLHTMHIGDSRLFRVDKQFHLKKLTKDHSLVQMMVELGEITEEEALTHPRRSILLRSLGFDPNVEIDMASFEFQAGEMLLLCCDGLWSVVKEEQISKILKENTDLAQAAEQLVQAANDNGGPDNISCILVRKQ